MQWQAAFAVLCCLVASASALGSDLKFTARIDGKLAQTAIAWDGSTLTVPQHCRQETCTDNAQELANVKIELADELSKLRGLLAEQKTYHEEHLQTELRKQKAMHDAELRTIADRLAAVEVAAGTNDQSIDELRAADLSHQSQISANDQELTSLQETDRDHANQIDSNYERVNDADQKTFYLHQITMQHQKGIDANANAIKGVGQTLEATTGELRQADLRHDDAIARVSKMEGPRGLQGATGPRGERGADGADGRDGVDGRDGIDGKDGRDGIDGKDGRDGIDGKDGKDGKDGESAPTPPPTPLVSPNFANGHPKAAFEMEKPPLHYWDLKAPISSGRFADDPRRGVSRNDMIAQGPSTQASEGVRQFASCDSYLKSEEPFDDVLLGRTPKTISAWYKLKDCNGDGDGSTPLFGFGSTSVADGHLGSSFALDNNRCNPQMVGYGKDFLDRSITVEKHKWVHLVATFDAKPTGGDDTGTVELFMNGNSLGRRPLWLSTERNRSTKFMIGRDSWHGGTNHNICDSGKVGEAKVWDSALTADEVRQLYDTHLPLLPPMCSYREFAPTGCPYCRMQLACPYGSGQCEGKGAVYPLGSASGSNPGGCTKYCRKWCNLDMATGKAQWSDSSTTSQAEMLKWNEVLRARLERGP